MLAIFKHNEQVMADPCVRKAVALISGGLDSMLATKWCQSQGIYVEGLNFFTGFCVEGHTSAIRNRDKKQLKRNNALWVAEQLGIKLHIIDVVEEYKNVVINPKFGYGANMNPCLDCKIFMIKKAKQWIIDNQFDFIITGEVIGQRPKSQKKHTMPLIAKHSGADDRLVRPLCAKFLPPTLPEREGWLDREKMLGFNGRSRKPQIQLAQSYGISEYSQPAGGCCFLTDKNYSMKLKDLWQSQGQRQYELDDIMLLKVGRHLRYTPGFKLIIGRDQGENNYLQGYRKQFHFLSSSTHLGPNMLIDGKPCAEDFHFAARILARYCDCPTDEQTTIEMRTLEGVITHMTVTPLSPEEILPQWHIENSQITQLPSVS